LPVALNICLRGATSIMKRLDETGIDALARRMGMVLA